MLSARASMRPLAPLPGRSDGEPRCVQRRGRSGHICVANLVAMIQIARFKLRLVHCQSVSPWVRTLVMVLRKVRFDTSMEGLDLPRGTLHPTINGSVRCNHSAGAVSAAPVHVNCRPIVRKFTSSRTGQLFTPHSPFPVVPLDTML